MNVHDIVILSLGVVDLALDLKNAGSDSSSVFGLIVFGLKLLNTGRGVSDFGLGFKSLQLVSLGVTVLGVKVTELGRGVGEGALGVTVLDQGIVDLGRCTVERDVFDVDDFGRLRDSNNV